MKNVREKGKSHEREVAKLLSDWAGAKFMRTPGSGNIRHFNDQRVLSDIVAPLSIGKFPFSIECKNVEYPWELNNYIEEKSTFFDHWNQASTDAHKESLIPMLVFTKNYRGIYLAISENVFNEIQLINKIEYKGNYIVLHIKKSGVLVVCDFKEFLNTFSLRNIMIFAEEEKFRD